MTRTRSLDEKLTRAKKIQGLSEKVSIANNANADLFLSVHANTGLPDSYGTESFYTTPQSEEFAQMIHKHLVKATSFGDRELKKRSLNVTRNTKMPSVLVEVGFLTNQVENHKMFDPSFQQGVARELAAGITEYYDRAGDQGNNTDVSRRN
ncbi:N-acetylmuramoyl-L-alanine amidase family protein [Aneurinibacillus tyrosinisolvens]|uniref:N-acetylmuramoyl-L-alanine amidase family protein n=1 Tax=Aneurinibacillus tyrosinisolvens TaxID=1443435 RepID=UPI00069984A4|nr:N-acetylmuramoyl-L-alanine amidase [Aneurinibacillus tyrosinisolvens]